MICYTDWISWQHLRDFVDYWQLMIVHLRRVETCDPRLRLICLLDGSPVDGQGTTVVRGMTFLRKKGKFSIQIIDINVWLHNNRMIIIHNFPPRPGVGQCVIRPQPQTGQLALSDDDDDGCTVKERNAKKKQEKEKKKKTDDVVSERGRSLTGNWYHGNVEKGEAKGLKGKKKHVWKRKWIDVSRFF